MTQGAGAWTRSPRHPPRLQTQPRAAEQHPRDPLTLWQLERGGAGRWAGLREVHTACPRSGAINVRSGQRASEFVGSAKARSPRCGSRPDRQETLPPRSKADQGGRVPASSARVPRMLAAGVCPVWDDCTPSSTTGAVKPRATPQSPRPRPQVCAAPTGGQFVPTLCPVAGKSGSGGVLRAPGPGRSGAAAPTIPGRAPASSPPPSPHLRAGEQRCIV